MQAARDLGSITLSAWTTAVDKHPGQDFKYDYHLRWYSVLSVIAITVAIFRSELLHEVLPCAAGAGRPRLALTLWALAKRGTRAPANFLY